MRRLGLAAVTLSTSVCLVLGTGCAEEPKKKREVQSRKKSRPEPRLTPPPPQPEVEAPPEPPLFDPGTAHPLDDELEQRASDRLDDQAPLDSAARGLVVQAIEQSFDALGFPAVVSLAQRLLARDDEWDGIAQVRLQIGRAHV